MTDYRRDDDIPPESYGDLAALMRSMNDTDFALDEPPTDLWSRIEADVARTDDVGADGGHSQPAEQTAQIDERDDDSRVVPMQRRGPGPAASRRPRWVGPALAAAAAAVVIGGIAAVTVGGDNDGDGTDIATVTLSNEGLDPSGSSSRGDATLVRRGDGTYELRVEVGDLPSDVDGFFELWVIDENVEGMVSLGPLGSGGTFVLPAGVDPARFPVVDISIEPVDGVPTHSGDSILRGVIDA